MLVYIFALRYMVQLMVVGAAVGVIYLFGPSWETISGGIGRAWRGLSGFVRGLAPSTRTQWGIVAIVSAFVLLGVGAVLSLYRAARPISEANAADAAGPDNAGSPPPNPPS